MPGMIHLGFDFSYNHMGGRWRLPGALGGHVFPDVALYEEVARVAERGCLDLLFSGDGTGVPDTWRGSRDAAVAWGVNWPRQDIQPLAVAMSRVTRHVGFGLTYSSSFMHPYYMARLMNALDHVTGGRIALNLVASTRPADFRNYGMDALTGHADRYAQMEEFTDVCRKLWDATEDGAMVWDAGTGQAGDPARVHAMRHEGRFFTVEGPLNTPPSPQGRPVLIQAGGSARGVEASAHVADHVFGADMALPLQVKQRALLDQALAARGRDPAAVGILWQQPIVVAETHAEAVARRDALLDIIPAEAVGAYLSYNIGYDLSGLPARFTLGALHAEIVARQASPAGFVGELVATLGPELEMTRDEFLERGRLAATGFDKTIAGTAPEMADHLEAVFEATGARGGFMLGHTPALLPDLSAIVELLVPELRRRGRFRSEYKGRTLRETLALEA